MAVTFGICTDVHSEFIHDSVERMKIFLEECKKENVDFCITLGDFCPPGKTNLLHKEKILSMINDFSIPFYHVLGNHDLDRNCKEDVCEYLNINNPHCSFDCGGLHFILADACFFKLGDSFKPYNRGNYWNPHADIPYLSPDELKWISEDLKKAKYPSIIFSHQSLIESRSGIKNAEEFREIIKDSPMGVKMCVCGHEHVDRAEKKDGVWYVCINSMSYYWAGHEYEHTTYGEKIEKDYPVLRQVFPYKEPLYAIITVTDDKIIIKGKETLIVGKTPEEMNFSKKGLEDKVTPKISDRILL